MDSVTRKKLDHLLTLSLEGTITAEQINELNRLIGYHAEAMAYCIDFLKTVACLYKTKGHLWGTERVRSFDIHEMLGEVIERDEQIRIGKGIHFVEERREEIRKAAERAFQRFKEQERRRQQELAYKQYRAQRRNLICAVVSLTVLLTIVVFVWLSGLKQQSSPNATIPLTPPPPAVATISQSANARWLRTDLNTNPGTTLIASWMYLEQGLVEITFNKGAQVILQAPCELELENDGQMFLQVGSLSAKIPKRAHGFVVRTPTGTVVDYGTEFGMTVCRDGKTEAHVYEGKVDLRSGSDPIRFDKTKRLEAGQAGMVDASGTLTTKPFHPNQTVREMPKQKNFAIPGVRLSLADVVGGGNGFGTGYPGSAIDVLTGQLVLDFYHPSGTARLWEKKDSNESGYKYIQVPDYPYIDGVFMPMSLTNICISSLGHTFTIDILPNNKHIASYIGYWQTSPQPKPGIDPVLNGRVYASTSNPSIIMFRNKGITFDLDAVRQDLVGTRIIRFTALCGISQNNQGTINPIASFYVLVDGKVAARYMELSPMSGGRAVCVELKDTDRFLTLVTAFKVIGTDGNYAMFAEPAFDLAPVMSSSQDKQVKRGGGEVAHDL